MKQLRILLLTAISHVLLGHASKHKKRGDPAQEQAAKEGKSYLLHQECPTGYEGFGRHIEWLRGSVDVAVRHNLTLVCNPFDFDASAHGAGNLGHVFGCRSDGTVTGNLATQYDMHALESKKLLAAQFVDVVDQNKPSIRLTAPIAPKQIYVVRRGKTCEWKTLPDGRVVNNPEVFKANSLWGEGWRWFRSQYALVYSQSKNRKKRSCWAATAPGKKHIALHLRRGDDELSWRAFTAETYVDILRRVFSNEIPGAPQISEEDAVIQVVAETTLEKEPQLELIRSSFKEADVHFRLSDPARKKSAEADNVVADMDCFHDADLILSSEGTFSQLLSVIQKQGGKTICMNSNGFIPLPSYLRDPLESHHQLLTKEMLRGEPAQPSSAKQKDNQKIAFLSVSKRNPPGVLSSKKGELPSVIDVFMG